MESRLASAPHVGRLVAAVAVAALLALPRSAAADEAPARAPIAEKAKKHLQLGLTHYQAKDYEAAIREFQAGYDIDPHPAFLFAWAQAERLSGDCRSAIFAYERFLDTKPDEQQEQATHNAIARCRVALGPDADKPQADEDRASVAAMPASPATTAVQAPVTRTVVIRDDRQPSWYKDGLGGALLGTGVAALAVGIGYYVASSSDLSAANDAETYGEYQILVDRADSRRTTAWVGIGVGTALVSGAGLRYFSQRRTGKRRDLAVNVSSDGAGFVYSTAF